MELVYLLVSAGGGPTECRLAVGHVLARMRQEADVLGVDVSCSTEEKAPASAQIALVGTGSRDGRSQHQNKATALERLQALVKAAEADARAGSKAAAHTRHRQ